MTETYTSFINFHVVFSITFSMIAISLTFRSLYGWIRNVDFTKWDNYLGITYLFFLYADLIQGIILYFFLKRPDEAWSTIQAMEYSSIRFWAIKHFSIMLFVVILSQIGRIFTTRRIDSRKKFKYAFFYYGAATFITLTSVGMYLLTR
jgi:hypothetical protein